MSSLNKIILIGSLTTDPEQRTTNSGDAFSRFTLAVDRMTGPEGVASATDFIPVVAWRDLAQHVQSLTKGDRAMVDGRIVTRTFDDEEGKRHYVTEVEARIINALSGASVGIASPSQVAVTPAPVSDVKPAPVVTPVAAPVLEYKSVTPVAEDDFDFGESLPDSFTEEVEEDIPF